MERQKWLRLQIPESAHTKIRGLAKENRNGVARQAEKILIQASQETSVLESVLQIVMPTAENIEVNRKDQLLSVAWSENGASKRFILDTSTNELHKRIDKD